MSKAHQATRRGFILAGSAAGALSALGSFSALAAEQGKASAKAARAPVLFIGHGGPMNALRDNSFTRSLQAWGPSLPRPKAMLVVSAHWLTPGATAVGVQERPETIHDFGGFPPMLHAMQYPAPGSPAFAREAIASVKSTRVLPTTEWGLDHGTWTVLHHIYPAADIPVFQLSIDYDKPAAYHYAIGRELAALRDRGVMIIGSGNVVHNLRATMRGAPDSERAGQAWAQGFDDAFARALDQRDDKRLIDYARMEGAATAVATPDHYYPMLYALGAATAGESAKTIFAGFQSGTLSMRCFQFG
ncbi:4,5-DOPA dioxygenase extradiol [Uliginosibacterium sp. H3]|uniref:4,5-DOPA dioxygenase extradiol n=1 Tax=Uliginosibacterium silvisoli TaxID=3114758 RepID=A0ABU6K6D9_9RHOO|nr:4,5-DOPA dioxygenase extradiol [Uliginosibacterium sp. H3]